MHERMGIASHPTDGDLVRYLDAELAELPERRLRTHLERCERCAGRIATIAAESRTVARYLAAAEVVGPDEVGRARALAAARRASATREVERRGGIRTAAAAAVLLLLALGANPVRAWIADRWDTLRDTPSAADDVVTLPPALVYRSSVVAFAPRGATFELHIERAQVEGSLTVEVREAERASARIENGADETMLVLPSGLRVENSAHSRASYRVTVPVGAGALRVVVAGRTVATLDAGPGAAPVARTFALTEPVAGR